VFGAGGGTSAYREAEETDLIILWGSNARETHPIFFHHVLKGKRRGARLYAIDPRRTSSAAFADVWLGLEVGSDVALSNALAREIIAAGLCNTEFIARATTGFEEYKASVEPYTLERGEALTGVKAEVIRELAHAYARADRAQACWTLGITEHHNAVDNVFGIINLSLLTGHVGRWGSGLVPLRGQNNVQGGGDMGAIPNKFPGGQDVENAENHAKFEQAYGQKIPMKRGMHLSQMFEAMEHGTMKALYVLGENPIQSEADAKRARKLLEGVDLMIVQGAGTRKFTKRTFHSLRHSFNSALANSGVPEEVRMKLTGHSSRDMNTKYTHLQVATLRDAVSNMPLFTRGVKKGAR